MSIFYSSDWYCYCNNLDNSQCKLCTTPLKFPDFEEQIKRNIFNVDFLKDYYEKLCDGLLQLFDQRKESIECFQGEYVSNNRDWYTGETWCVTLPESI